MTYPFDNQNEVLKLTTLKSYKENDLIYSKLEVFNYFLGTEEYFIEFKLDLLNNNIHYEDISKSFLLHCFFNVETYQCRQYYASEIPITVITKKIQKLPGKTKLRTSEGYTKRIHGPLVVICTTHLYVADPNLRIYKKLDYEKLSLKTFQLGILEPYRSFLIHFELNTLEECLNKCRLYDNRKQEEQYYDYVRRPLRKPQPMQHQSFKSHYSFQKSPQTFSTPQKPHQLFYAQMPQNSFNTQNIRPNFYSQFNNQPKPFSASINKPINQSFRNFTNKQVFGNPKPIIPQSQYKPTSMSGISTFTNNKIKPPQNFDQSSSNPRRNFISEELNNVEPEQLEVVQDELEKIYQGDHIQDDYDQKEDENFWEPASNFPTTI
ncbi:hypothetical protein FQA39_LY12057 [Lamprigera yunnana]|nr:hypothetical protein FQA39_LY12057 [Lamprigera yunnana]